MIRIEKLAVGLLMITGISGAAQLSSEHFKVDLTPDFPGLSSYDYAGHAVSLPKHSNPVVRLNGKDYTPVVRLVPVSATEAAYLLSFNDLAVTMTAKVVITRNALTMTIEDVRESGSFAVRSIEIPGLVLLQGHATAEAAIANFPASSYASEKPEDHDLFGKVAEIAFKDNEKNKDKNRDALGNRGASYVFVSDGQIAAGLYTNVMDENLRMIVKLDGEGDAKTLTAGPGKWTYREIPNEICPTPTVKLVVAVDLNQDRKVTWQDAAIAYRGVVPQPYGGEKTKDYPIAHIAMNFGSQATNPFLRVLDNAKKVWLLTDGLGQRIQYKGYESEGHDSSHPDYAGNVGRRQGGREELNFAMRRGHDFNVLSGVHINAHEYHKESKTFSTDIADLNAIGWCWLDESYLTDYRYDSAYGTLYQRLDDMRQDLPWLDFVYLDVYYGRGWPGWRMHTKNNTNGLLQFTEFPGVMERGVVWNHVANDWTQAIGGKGDRSEIARFIWFSQKDTFKHEPLLRGSNCDGFSGWHGERNLPQTIKSAFTVNLPTKYLQHFQLLRQEAQQAWFSGGAHTESDGKVSKLFGRDGQLINSCCYEKENTRPVDNLSFIPWNPYTEDKIYHWNDKGGDSTWELPKSWAGRTSADLYRLTDLGRVFERTVEIADGKVTMTGIQANTAYVLYRDTPPALPDMKWSEGGLVKDTGFDSHSFTNWKLITPADSAVIENEKEWTQTELLVGTPAPAEVRQSVTGLTAGQTYAASVWVSIKGERDASITVEPSAPTAPAFVDKQSWKIVSATKQLGGDKPRKMLDENPKTLWHTVKLDEGVKEKPQVTISFGKPLTLSGFVQTSRDDMGNGIIKGFEAYTSMDNKTWTKSASGDFSYAENNRATVKFSKPVVAKFFRLVATSETQGRPYASIAELDMTLVDAPQSKSLPAFAPVTNAINATYLTNFTDQSSKYMRNWHRMKVMFTAPSDGRADIVLRAGKGSADASVRFDDVRLVKSGVSTPPAGAKKVVLFEDFENVDEAWGPFMYGWQGPMNTHLSEANPPYTDDTIGGKYSLKSRLEDSPDMLYRTVPATLKLKPNTTYKVSFDYLSDKADCFALVTGSESADGQKIESKNNLGGGEWKPKKFTATIKTGPNPGAFIGISKLAKENKGTVVIDNVLITE